MVIALNMTLGTGPLMLPYAFAQAGLLLSAGFLAFCAIVAYITTTYIIETLVLENADLFEKTESGLFRHLLEATSEADKDEPEINEQDLTASVRHSRPDKVFKIRERIEMGEMGHRVLPGFLYDLLYLCLFLHTFGCLCVYAVALTSSVEVLLPGGSELHGEIVLGLAAIVFPLCFADMQKLRNIQWGIMLVRVVAIIAMMFCACYLAYKAGAPPAEENASDNEGAWMWGGVPLADPSGLPSLFANAVLAFMVHHSLPGFLAPLQDQNDAHKAVGIAYAGAYVTYLLLGTTALFAFGRNVPQLYNLAFASFPLGAVSEFLCGYPLMLLAVYPIVGISFRNNFLGALGLPPPNPKGPVAAKDVVATAVASLPPLGVAYVTSNVQGIVKIFAGYFGLSLMLVMPCVLVIKARRAIPASEEAFPLKSRWASTPILAVVLLSWVSAISFNTYRFFFA